MKLEAAIQEIKRRTDIAQVIGQTLKLTKHGSHYLGLCPFHVEKTPSFHVRPDKGYFKCFGCGAGGDVFEFLQKQTGQLFMDIVKRLAAEHHIELDQNYQPRVNPAVLESLTQMQVAFRRQLTGEALCYLTEKRRYPTELIDKMELGFGGSQSGQFQGRITIPIKNQRGQLVAFGGRIFGEAEKNRPKYINSAASEIYEKSQVLYGLYESLALIKQQKHCVLVEGYFDVMALLAVGIPAVAPCGTSLTESHVELLKKYTEQVILCFDQDSAGKIAHEKALLLFLSKGFQVQAVMLPEKDPDSLWQQGQKDLLLKLFEKPKDAVELRVNQALEESLGGVHQRIQALEALVPVLSASPDPLVNRQYVRLAAQILKEDEALLSRAVLKHRPGSLNKPAPARIESEDRVIWSDAEKLLLSAMAAYPEMIQEYEDLREIHQNPELSLLMEGIFKGQSLLEIEVPKNSGLMRELIHALDRSKVLSKEEAREIFVGWLTQIGQQKKQAWLKEQHQKLISATHQGNLDEVRAVLKDQSGALKKGWN